MQTEPTWINKLKQQMVRSLMFSFITEVTYYSQLFFKLIRSKLFLANVYLTSHLVNKPNEKQIEKKTTEN